MWSIKSQEKKETESDSLKLISEIDRIVEDYNKKYDDLIKILKHTS